MFSDLSFVLSVLDLFLFVFVLLRGSFLLFASEFDMLWLCSLALVPSLLGRKSCELLEVPVDILDRHVISFLKDDLTSLAQNANTCRAFEALKSAMEC